MHLETAKGQCALSKNKKKWHMNKHFFFYPQTEAQFCFLAGFLPHCMSGAGKVHKLMRRPNNLTFKLYFLSRILGKQKNKQSSSSSSSSSSWGSVIGSTSQRFYLSWSRSRVLQNSKFKILVISVLIREKVYFLGQDFN